MKSIKLIYETNEIIKTKNTKIENIINKIINNIITTQNEVEKENE